MPEETFHITQIASQKRRKDRVNIYLDGAYAFSLNRDVVIENHLHQGDPINSRQIDALLLGDEIKKAKEKGLAFLSYRARSTKEFERKLSERGFHQKTIQEVVSDFERVGLLDDDRFASSFARTKLIQKPVGKHVLLRELAIKGIDEETAARAVDEAYGAKSEYDLALDIAQKKTRRMSGDAAQILKQKKRMSDLLARRGFGWPVISDVLQNVFGSVTD